MVKSIFAFLISKYQGGKIHLRNGTPSLAAKSMGVMKTNSTNSELGRRCKKGESRGKNELLEQHLQQAQSKPELHPEKFGIIYPLQIVQITNFILQMKGKAPTWRKFNFWDQILSPPHILGTINISFEIVIERTG